MTWTFPLLGATTWPDAPGYFGAKRRYDIHTGIDLYVADGTTVVSAEDGVVTHIEAFTGPEANSPWWEDTKGVCVEGESGVLVYGEIDSLWIREGSVVKAGDPIGRVKRVLREDKGRPTSMLHFELHHHGTRGELPIWTNVRPRSLRDPTPLIREAWEASAVQAGTASVKALEVRVLEESGLSTWVAAPMHPGWKNRSPEEPMAAHLCTYLDYCQHQLDVNGYLLNAQLARVPAVGIQGVRQRVR